ncbi:Uu.00g118070.m01.CDS01 [Anthostomella pinea]|uniref:Uu.00g118070.m01.CDS01 n=1 Tax=Anthostomella pinea TaxID=933095 RepID=A0AAI8VGD7_9PEZI|nr:Uu.00g118070.m01.CDS01 [Anthostomella pinea]
MDTYPYPYRPLSLSEVVAISFVALLIIGPLSVVFAAVLICPDDCCGVRRRRLRQRTLDRWREEAGLVRYRHGLGHGHDRGFGGSRSRSSSRSRELHEEHQGHQGRYGDAQREDGSRSGDARHASYETRENLNDSAEGSSMSRSMSQGGTREADSGYDSGDELTTGDSDGYGSSLSSPVRDPPGRPIYVIPEEEMRGWMIGPSGSREGRVRGVIGSEMAVSLSGGGGSRSDGDGDGDGEKGEVSVVRPASV